MAIKINANMALGSAQYLDDRQSVADLDALLALDTNIIPNGFECYVETLDCKYKYHEDYNETSTGNWKLSTGGGDNSTTLTQEEYEALTEEEKLDGLYYTYDTKRIYKNGVQYGASEPIPLTMEEYKALKEAGAIDEQQEYLIEANTEGILLGAEDIGYNNAESDIQATTVQGAIDNVVEKVDGLISDTTSSTTSTWSSQKTSDEIAKKVDKSYVDDSLGELSTLNTVKKSDANECVLDKEGQGNFYVENGGSNLPNNEYTHWYINTVAQNKNAQKQVAYSTHTDRIYIRKYVSYKFSDWQELATMDKVVPQVIIENKTTDDVRTIIQNSWGAFPTNNSLVRIETSIFTWSAQIYKHDSSWGTIILTCYADNQDSYIGKLSNKVWHWYKMGLTEV